MRTGRLVTRLDVYMFRQLFLALIAVTGGLTALIWLTQSLRFVELVVNHGLSLFVFLHLTGLLVPSLAAVILPITTYVVIQFVYQRLAGDRELTVMRSAGLSPFALARPALVLVLFSLAAGYLLNLWLVPISLRAFREFQWEIRNSMAAFLIQEGVFTEVSPDLTVYVRSRDPDGTLRGILVDDARDKTSPATILAQRGRLVEGLDGPRVVLLDGSREVIDHQTGRLNILSFDENDMDLSDSTRNGGTRTADMSEVSLHALLHPRQATPVDRPKWVAEAHKRLTTPLTAVSYGMVALLTVLTGAFRRHGGFARPLASIGSVVGLLALELAFQNLAARQNALIPLMWIQAVLPGIVCAWLLFAPQVLGARVRRVSHAT